MKHLKHFSKRKSFVAYLIVSGLVAWAPLASAAPVPYRFISLYSQDTAIGSLQVEWPSINNAGTVAIVIAGSLQTIDGPITTVVDDPDNFSLLRPDINNAGQISVHASTFSGFVRVIRRYEPDGTLTELAYGLFDCSAGEFCEFGLTDINDAGQVAAKATLNSAGTPTFTVHLFDATSDTEIARQATANSGDVFNFSTPSLNNSGAVAFGARQVDNPGGHVFSGTGGPLTLEWTVPGGGSSEMVWNNSGMIATINGQGLYLVQGGAVVDTIIDPATSTGVFTNPRRAAINNLGDIIFVTENGASCGSGGNEWGLFTGGDEINDVVIRTGDALFDGTVNTCGPNGQTIRMGAHALNDHGEAVFLIETTTITGFVSHVVRAIPLSPLYDSDGDGIANDVDNCLIVDNPSQTDGNGDGYGNECDADLDDNGIINFLDLSVFGPLFLTADPAADFNVDGVVNFLDLFIFSQYFLGSPGPSALAP